ncbi:MAG TPA: hypothetical protein VF255_06760 [Solirubrobacterales bacterium]
MSDSPWAPSALLRLWLALALSIGLLTATEQDAVAAVSETPVWIGAPYAGFYSDVSRPGRHGGNQVAFDYYAPAGTTARVYAAPKNAAYNNQITAHITASGASSCGAAYGGYWVQVQLRHGSSPIGYVTYHHLQSNNTLRGPISRWGGVVGKVGSFKYSSCWQVRTAQGAHLHIEFRNLNTKRPACAHDYGAVSLSATNYQGYLGVYSKPQLSGNRCPSGI